MKAQRLILMVALASLAGVALACGSVCSKAESLSASLAEKSAPCSSDGGMTITDTFNKASCEADLKNCTDADLDIVEKQLDCMDGVSACVKGSEMAFVGSLMACAGDAAKISPACNAALDGK